jgi:regulator of sigma E protease
MVTALAFIFVLGLLIFVHELGHFGAAKWAGIRVERFSLGFPPRMIGRKIGETDYCISWIPLGGYVKMAGMVDESLDAPIEGQPWEFMSKPIWKRAIVIAAGPVMNLFLTLVLFTVLHLHYGVPEIAAIVGRVLPDSPAAATGLKTGDRVVAVEGKRVETWEQLTSVIHAGPEKEVLIEWERHGERMQANVTPRLDPDNEIGFIGISRKTRRLGLGESFVISCAQSWFLTREIFKFVGRLFIGKESVREGLAGPIQIAKIAGESARQGLGDLFYFTALMSLQLAVLNILPVPVLDGGHLVFLGLEAILRRPVSVRARVVVQKIGLSLLLTLMVFVIMNDVRRLTQ